jgi:hypothetical protein
MARTAAATTACRGRSHVRQAAAPRNYAVRFIGRRTDRMRPRRHPRRSPRPTSRLSASNLEMRSGIRTQEPERRRHGPSSPAGVRERDRAEPSCSLTGSRPFQSRPQPIMGWACRTATAIVLELWTTAGTASPRVCASGTTVIAIMQVPVLEGTMPAGGAGVGVTPAVMGRGALAKNEGAPEVPDSRPTTMGSLEQERW